MSVRRKGPKATAIRVATYVLRPTCNRDPTEETPMKILLPVDGSDYTDFIKLFRLIYNRSTRSSYETR